MNFNNKKYQKLIDLIENFDLYKKYLFLSFHRKNTFASIYGLIFSLFYYIFFITIFLYYLIELLNRKNFNINFTHIFNHLQKLTFQTNQFFLEFMTNLEIFLI